MAEAIIALVIITMITFAALTVIEAGTSANKKTGDYSDLSVIVNNGLETFKYTQNTSQFETVFPYERGVEGGSGDYYVSSNKYIFKQDYYVLTIELNYSSKIYNASIKSVKDSVEVYKLSYTKG